LWYKTGDFNVRVCFHSRFEAISVVALLLLTAAAARAQEPWAAPGGDDPCGNELVRCVDEADIRMWVFATAYDAEDLRSRTKDDPVSAFIVWINEQAGGDDQTRFTTLLDPQSQFVGMVVRDSAFTDGVRSWLDGQKEKSTLKLGKHGLKRATLIYRREQDPDDRREFTAIFMVELSSGERFGLTVRSVGGRMYMVVPLGW
jgi:hypothetical protein